MAACNQRGALAEIHPGRKERPLTPRSPTCGLMEESSSGEMETTERKEETKKASQKSLRKRSQEERNEEQEEVRAEDRQAEGENGS